MDARKILWIDPHGKGPNWPVKPVWHSVEYVRKDIHDAALQDLTLQGLAHQGQAQEAYEAQLKAEARITELEAALKCVRDSTHHPVELIAIARQVLPKETP